jgi:hypothetical protein
MFPSWAVKRSLSRRAPLRTACGRRAKDVAVRVSTLLLFLAGASWSILELRAADGPAPAAVGADSTDIRPAKSRTLVLGVRYGDPADAERLHKRIGDALALLACVDDFDCRLSSQLLGCVRSAHMVADGPFEDVLLNIPVSGTAHVEGSLKITTIPDSTRAAFEMHIEGTAQLQGIGHKRGVRIDSDATSRFHATKRLLLDNAGLACLPATCSAETSLATTGIASRQPRLIGKFSERIAQQRVIENHKAAEAECSDHVAGAIRAAMDREVGALITAFNAALDEHLAAASEAQRLSWRRVRFRSEADCLSITRAGEGSVQFASWKPEDGKPAPPIQLRLPRAKFDVNRLLMGLEFLGSSKADGAAISTAAAQASMALRPSVTWQKETVTVSLHYEPVARLAQEPVVGAAQ